MMCRMWLKIWPKLRAAFVLSGFVFLLATGRAQQDETATAGRMPPKYAKHIISVSEKTRFPLPAMRPWPATISFRRRRFQPRNIADGVMRKRTASGARRCIPIPFARLSIAPASTFCCAPRASNLRGTAIAATIPSRCCRERSTQDSQVDRSFDEDGVTCTTCHSIQKLLSTNGNGGYRDGRSGGDGG